MAPFLSYLRDDLAVLGVDLHHPAHLPQEAEDLVQLERRGDAHGNVSAKLTPEPYPTLPCPAA